MCREHKRMKKREWKIDGKETGSKRHRQANRVRKRDKVEENDRKKKGEKEKR